MRHRRSPSRKVVILLALIAVCAVLILAAGVFYGWGSARTSNSSKPPPLVPLSITFAAETSAEVEDLLTTLQQYVEPGDSFDLVDGSPENPNVTITPTVVNVWAQELHAAYPGDAIYVHTAGIRNYDSMAAGVDALVTGILYDYEPNFEPEFTLNFTQTVANFKNITIIAHGHGVLSVGYPIGLPLLKSYDQHYGWNYATLGRVVDRLIIQSQTYCLDGPSEYGNATGAALQQYAAADMTNLPTFQITIGNSTTALPNGVTAGPAFGCARQLVDLGQHSVYLWWDQGALSNVVDFLQDLGRN